MKLKDKDGWEDCVKINDDPYGKAAVDVARRVMEAIDDCLPIKNCNALISEADNDPVNGGITGFQAGCVAQMVYLYHERGEEFRRAWNIETQIRDEGEMANKKDGATLNPALMIIGGE